MGNDNNPGQRMVYCIKLQKELPGLDEPPFDGELGQRIYSMLQETIPSPVRDDAMRSNSHTDFLAPAGKNNG